MTSRLPSQIVSERLILRLPESADVAALNRAIVDSHAELKAWMEWAVEPQKMDETRKFCAESRASWESEAVFNCLMVDRESGEIIGSCGYPRLDWSVPKFEIGYWCRTDRVGRGYVSEATWTLARHAFEALGANRVELRMDDANVRSWRVAERLGFSHEATLSNESVSPDGSLRDTRIYAATRLDQLSQPTG
jgi:RimJ/RimL family protein N-acetyltransferase